MSGSEEWLKNPLKGLNGRLNRGTRFLMSKSALIFAEIGS
jgi:hypothetical protein